MNSSLINIKSVETALPVFAANISQHSEALRQAYQAILDLKSNNSDSIKSNVIANYVSSWTSHLESSKLTPLCNLVLSFCSEVSKVYFNCNADFRVSNCWGAIYEKGDHAKPHSHFPATFAAIVYLEVDEESAPLVIENSLEIAPTSGSLLVFPGLLHHEVPETNSKRTVVAMNVELISKVVKD